jgi:hypothetical protein
LRSGYTKRFGNVLLLAVDAEVESFSATQPFPGKTPIVIVWYPDPMRVGITDQRVADFLQGAGVSFFSKKRRVPAKLDFYSQVCAIELVVGSESEWGKAQRAVEEGIRLFGGRAVCVVATE